MTLRLLLASLIATTLSYGALAGTPAHAAEDCDPNNQVIGDFDSDGVADLAVGNEVFDSERGAVEVFFANGDTEQVTATSLGFGTPDVFSWFGAALTAHDLNADGCDDLVIGSPGYDSASGRVYVAWGHADGTFSAGPVLDHIEPEARFGSSLALTAPTAGPTATRDARLFVGAPYADTSGKEDAGAVGVFSMSLEDAVWTVGPVLTQNAPKIENSAEAGDLFGAVLAAWGNTLVVTAPGEDFDGLQNPGYVHVISLSSANPTSVVTATVTHQDKPGVGGVSEKNDAFGSSVAIMGRQIAIGNVREFYKAGTVQLYDWHAPSSTLTPLTMLDQNSPGVPGKRQRSAYFGWSVAWSKGALAPGKQTLLVGAPYTDRAGLSDVGAAYALQVNANGAVTKSALYPNPMPQEGARFGGAIAPLRDSASLGDDGRDSVAIGAPLYDAGLTVEAGHVWWGSPGFLAPIEKQSLAGAIAYQSFGSVLCQPGSN